MEPAVFVYIAKLMKKPERMRLRIVPSIIRLQSRNGCLRCWRNAPDLIKPAIPLGESSSCDSMVFPFVNEDGEFTSLQVTIESYIGHSELVSKMIEGRTHLIDDFAGENTQDSRGVMGNRQLNSKTICSLLFKLEVWNDFIGLTFEINPNFFVKSFQMLVCSREFAQYSIDRRHEL